MLNNDVPDTQEIKRMAIKGVMWSGAQIFGGKLVSFIVFALLARVLTPESFGLVALASLFISFVQIFVDQGFGDAIIQRVDLKEEHLDAAFWANLLISSLLTALCVVTAPLIASLFHEPDLDAIIPWLSLTFVLSGLSSTQQSLLRRQMAFKKLAWRSLIASLTGGVVGISFALLGYGVWSLVALNLVTNLVAVLILWSVSAWRPRFRFSKQHFGQLFSFGLNMIGIDLLNYLNRHADDLLIGYFLGAELLGYYTIAYRILVTMTELLTTVTNAVALPIFSRLQQESGLMRSAFFNAVQFVNILAMPAFIGVGLVAPELLFAVFGPQWSLSVPVLRILVFIGILHSTLYLHNSLVIAAGKPSWRLAMTLLNAVSNIIAFAIAVHWGIVAVAAAYVLRGYVLSPLEVWMVKKVTDIDIRQYLSQFIKPVLSSLAMSLAILGLRLGLDNALGLYARLAVFVLAGGLVYILAVYLLEPPFWPRLFRIARSGFTLEPVL